MRIRSRKNEYAVRRADRSLHDFVDALRGALDLEPIYAPGQGDKRQEQIDMERFYVPSHELPRASV